METRADLIFKWSAYSAAVLLFLLLQSHLSDVRILGVMPFLPPMLAALIAVFEPGAQGTVFSLCFGVLADLVLRDPLPCFYTLSFTAAALLAALIGTRLLNRGLLCSFAVASAAFFTADLLRVLWLCSHGAAFFDVLLRAGAELLISLPFVLLIHPVFSRLHRRFHLYD